MKRGRNFGGEIRDYWVLSRNRETWKVGAGREEQRYRRCRNFRSVFAFGRTDTVILERLTGYSVAL